MSLYRLLSQLPCLYSRGSWRAFFPEWEAKSFCRTGLWVSLKIKAAACETSWTDHSTHLLHHWIFLLPWDHLFSHEVQTGGNWLEAWLGSPSYWHSGLYFPFLWSTVFCAYKLQDLTSLCTRNAVTSMKYICKKWNTKGLLNTSAPTKSQEHTEYVNYTAAASTSWFWFMPHIWITPCFRAAVP